MNHTIKNKLITLNVDSLAAEMHSLKLNNYSYEFLWQGNPEYWWGRNPILFPQVSSTKEKKNIINGKEYPMRNHGFLRDKEFDFVEVKEDSLTLSYKDNEETLSQYPYHFELLVNYSLKENSVVISYEVKNLNEVDMPFGFGLHPAFNTEANFKDTKIVFDKLSELKLTKELFDEYPTYYEKPMPHYADLYTNDHHLRVDFEGFKILAVWSPVGPFVCIEPWMSAPALDRPVFEDRDDNIILKPKESFKISYKITLIK